MQVRSEAQSDRLIALVGDGLHSSEETILHQVRSLKQMTNLILRMQVHVMHVHIVASDCMSRSCQVTCEGHVK